MANPSFTLPVHAASANRGDSPEVSLRGRVMRELPVRLPPSLQARPRRQLWRDAFFFCASFTATFYASVLMLEHAAAVIA
jgi:hypothetical protein